MQGPWEGFWRDKQGAEPQRVGDPAFSFSEKGVGMFGCVRGKGLLCGP